MATSQLALTGGPGRSELLQAASQASPAVFDTPEGAIEVLITGVEQIGSQGEEFTFWGQLESTGARGAVLTGSYNCAERTGRLVLKKVARPLT
jgi:hypothetical protein